jgi:hypothetical protein
MKKDLIEYICKICNKNYSSYQSIWNHNKKFHIIQYNTINNTDNTLDNTLNNTLDNKYNCNYCKKLFNNYQNRWKHQKICKNKKVINEVNINNQLNNNINTTNNNSNTINNIDNIKDKHSKNIPIYNQLINIIVEKNKTIEELNNKIDNNIVVIPTIESKNFIQSTLTLNDVIIVSRPLDNYINATQLCKAGNKQFASWYRLESTKELINELGSDMQIHISQLIDIKKGNSENFKQGSWIHPQLAIQLAQWISPKFALQVSKWIIELFTNGSVEINKLLINQKNENKLKDQKIQLLQDICIKKQKRKQFPERNIIYILTTEANKKKKIYIIGKAIKLTNRLTVYNKTTEHEVIYYKECKTEEQMDIIERIVLEKLSKYKEKANRDRFILPVENDISLFTFIIDQSINFFN